MRLFGREDTQRDWVVLHQTDVEPVRPMKLDVRTYAGLVWAYASLVQDTHQLAAISTFHEGGLRDNGQGPVAQET